MTILYYDGDPDTTEMNDAYYSYALYNDIHDHDHRVHNLIGQNYTFTIYSKVDENTTQTSGNGIFFLRIIRRVNNTDGTFQYKQQNQPIKSVPQNLSINSTSNQHLITYRMEQLDCHLLKIYAACKGIRVRYFENINITMAEPMLERIEPFLPGRFDLQLRLMTFFTAHYEFVFRYDLGVTNT